MSSLPLYNDDKKSPHNPYTDTSSETSTDSKSEQEMTPPKRSRLVTRLVACIFILYFAIWPLAELAAYNVRRNYGFKHAADLRTLGEDISEGWQVVDVEGAGNAKGGIQGEGKAGRLVPLEAHIMSKCPDARDCLQKLVLPTMQRVSEKVNFTLSFIGT